MLAQRPNEPEAHYNLARVLRQRGQLAAAEGSYGQALLLRPDYIEARTNLANLLMDQGKFDQALESYQRVLDIEPNNVEALFNRADIKTFQPGDPDLARLEALAGQGSPVAEKKRPYVHFALGKAWEDVGDYDRAFGHWLAGNALRRRQIRYQRHRHQQTVRQIIEIFSAKFTGALAAVGDPSTAPIFVLGMPRSGTTLVEQILASHPEVHGAGELIVLHRIARTALDAAGRPLEYPGYVPQLGPNSLRRLGQAYLASLPPIAKGRTRITDKTPGNFWFVGLIRLALPNAKIIHTLRDPVDTCVSCFSKLFEDGQLFSYDLAELGHHYRLYRQLMDHWRAVLPANSLLDVAYEDVVDNLEQQARRILDYCGLALGSGLLGFSQDQSVGRNRQQRAGSSASLSQLAGTVAALPVPPRPSVGRAPGAAAAGMIVAAVSRGPLSRRPCAGTARRRLVPPSFSVGVQTRSAPSSN